MTVRTRAQLNSDADTYLPTNGVGGIDASKVRQRIKDLADSAVLPEDGTGLTAASQAEQEAASSTTKAVTPGRQHYHPSAAKFWGLATAAGALTTGYNLTSVTDGGTGDITFNIGTDFSSADWVHACGAMSQNGNGTYNNMHEATTTSKAAGTLRLQNKTGANGSSDPSTPWSVVGFGDQ